MGRVEVITDRTPGYADVARAFGYDPATGQLTADAEAAEVARRAAETAAEGD